MVRLGGFFENLGFLVRRVKILSKKDSEKLFGGAIIHYYRLYEPYLTYLWEEAKTESKQQEYKKVWENFKWLKEVITKIRQEEKS